MNGYPLEALVGLGLTARRDRGNARRYVREVGRSRRPDGEDDRRHLRGCSPLEQRLVGVRRLIRPFTERGSAIAYLGFGCTKKPPVLRLGLLGGV